MLPGSYFEPIQQPSQAVLRESPVVAWFIVKRIEHRGNDDEAPAFPESPIYVSDRGLEVKDMLKHVQAKYDIKFLIESHLGYINYRMPVLGTNVGTQEIVAGIETI